MHLGKWESHSEPSDQVVTNLFKTFNNLPNHTLSSRAIGKGQRSSCFSSSTMNQVKFVLHLGSPSVIRWSKWNRIFWIRDGLCRALGSRANPSPYQFDWKKVNQLETIRAPVLGVRTRGLGSLKVWHTLLAYNLRLQE